MKISGSFGVAVLPPVMTDAGPPPPSAPTSGSSSRADSVTFSSTARARAEAAAHPRWGALSARLHAEPEIADQVAYDFAHNATQPPLDATEFLNGTGPLRFAGTGEPYTPESKARFEQLANKLKTESIALYDQERAKGTSSADIYDKLIALGDAQSSEFRAMAKWDTM